MSQSLKAYIKENNLQVVSLPFSDFYNVHEEILLSISFKRVYDFGCGEGYLLWQIATAYSGLELIGIELDKNKSDLAKKINYFDNQLKIIQQDFFKYNYDFDDSLFISYDPFINSSKENTIKLFEFFQKHNAKNVILIEGYTDSFTQAINNVGKVKVIKSIRNQKDSTDQRERKIYHLDFSMEEIA